MVALIHHHVKVKDSPTLGHETHRHHELAAWSARRSSGELCTGQTLLRRAGGTAAAGRERGIDERRTQMAAARNFTRLMGGEHRGVRAGERRPGLGDDPHDHCMLEAEWRPSAASPESMQTSLCKNPHQRIDIIAVLHTRHGCVRSRHFRLTHYTRTALS